LDKNNNAVGLIDATLPRAIVHELAHATKLDREGSPLTKGIVDKLDNLEKQIQLDNKMAGAKYGVYNAKVRQEQGLLSKPLDSLARKEAGAVAVENYIINRVAFNGVKDQSLRLNVGDQGESITAQTLNEWHKAKDGVEGYSMPGTCKNGKPLEKEVTRLTPEQIFEVGTRLAALEPEQQQKLDSTHKAILGAYQLAQNARNQEAEV
jgi:hypothetical protein